MYTLLNWTFNRQADRQVRQMDTHKVGAGQRVSHKGQLMVNKSVKTHTHTNVTAHTENTDSGVLSTHTSSRNRTALSLQHTPL